MNKKWGIVILTVLAVGAVLLLKPRNVEHQPSTQHSKAAQRTLYLFHNAQDQDEGCRRIYAFADRAEKELSGKVLVRRPDVDRETDVLGRYSVTVLPTILIVGPGEKVEARFEGEGEEVEGALEKAFQGLKTAKQ